MLTRQELKFVGVTALGGLLEYYDFIIFALMAGYIAEAFFPGTDPNISLLSAFATFFVGYLSRPLGGLIFGHMGDCYGRKHTFAITVFIMAISTTLIGFLPTYSQIGIWAPILLITFRLLQGLSIGGELSGGLTLISETTQKHFGIAIGLLTLGVLSGQLLGYFINGLLLNFLSTEQVSEWGWRVPFWFGGSLGMLSYYIRRNLHESKLYIEIQKAKKQQKIPLITLVKYYKKQIVAGIFLITPTAVCMSLLFLFTQSYLTQLLNYDAEEVTYSGFFGISCVILVCIFYGWVADYNLKNNRPLYLTISACILVILSAYPLFSAYAVYHESAYLVALASSIIYGFTVVMANYLLCNAFPVSIRYSGIAVAYNTGVAIFGGMAPIIAMAIINFTDDLTSPSLYMIFSGFVGLIGCYLVRNNRIEVTETAQSL
ncbi:MAG: MFS transporter [Endozoicomonas sp.]